MHPNTNFVQCSIGEKKMTWSLNFSYSIYTPSKGKMCPRNVYTPSKGIMCPRNVNNVINVIALARGSFVSAK